MPIEIVSFPIISMVIFPSYVSHSPEGSDDWPSRRPWCRQWRMSSLAVPRIWFFDFPILDKTDNDQILSRFTESDSPIVEYVMCAMFVLFSCGVYLLILSAPVNERAESSWNLPEAARNCPSSFKGIPFWVSWQLTGLGRRVVVHSRSRDTQGESLLRSRRYPVKCIVLLMFATTFVNRALDDRLRCPLNDCEHVFFF